MIHEEQAMRDRTRVFADRSAAGHILGRMLAPHYSRVPDVQVLAIPMGGIPVAVPISEHLGCPLDLIIVRKIQIPGNTEAGFGAMTHSGEMFLNKSLIASLGLRPDQVDRQAKRVKQELAERNRLLRGGQEFPDLRGKTVIVVDDGLASGYTMKASLYMAAKYRALRRIVAVPTAPGRTAYRLADEVEALYCPNMRNGLSFAVADAYRSWHDLSEQEALELLRGG